MKSETRNCQNCKKEFLIDQEDFNFYEKIQVPPPTFCPECRFKIRGLWRNETTLYSGRKCDLCDKKILSMYHPESPYIVYCRECFISDKWDAQEFAQDYNSNAPFLGQVSQLFKTVPKNTTYLSTSDGPNLNSDYANMAGGMKDSYMVFNGGEGERLMYTRGIRRSIDTNDCYFGEALERCYECVNVFRSNGIIFGQNVFDSMDSMFVLNGSGLNNCFGCVNLRNKSYYFFNEPLDPKEYKSKVAEIMGSYQKLEAFKKKFYEFSLSFPRQSSNNLRTLNSVGDYLLECKNIKNSFEVVGAENSCNLFSSRNLKDSDGVIGYGNQSEKLLECVAVGYSSNIVSSCTVNDSSEIMYSFGLKNCHNCIGCDGLKNASYCILNKQYSKEEYEDLKSKIVSELRAQNQYGAMFPPEMAPFKYNETVAFDNLPMTKDEALEHNLGWRDDIQKTTGKETILPEALPDSIKEVQETILEQVLKCKNCDRNYKITTPELKFYQRMVLPLPRECFYCRHRDRVTRRGPYKFWSRQCSKCKIGIITKYAPDRPEIVYCEKCYQAEVY